MQVGIVLADPGYGNDTGFSDWTDRNRSSLRGRCARDASDRQHEDVQLLRSDPRVM